MNPTLTQLIILLPLMVLAASAIGAANYFFFRFVEIRIPLLVLSIGVFSIGFLVNFCLKLEPDPFSDHLSKSAGWSGFFFLLTVVCVLAGAKSHEPLKRHTNLLYSSLSIATTMSAANIWVSSLWENFFPSDVRQIPINSQSAISAYYVCIAVCYLAPLFAALVCKLAKNKESANRQGAVPPIAAP